MENWDQYTWIFALGTILAFACAFGIGANDVANSFGSSVGAKAITIGQAVMIAFVMEFAGAMSLGAAVTSTIKSGVANSDAFKDTPDLLMFGFLCALVAAAFWDNFACQMELAVSTTHTIVGAIVGMALVIKGSSEAVIWYKRIDEFPYISGVTAVLLSWVVSPISSGLCVLIIFGGLRMFVLRSEHSFMRGFYLLPAFVALTFFLIVIFIIQVGNKNDRWGEDIDDLKTVWISLACAVPIGILTLLIVMPLLKRWVEQEEAALNRAKSLEEGTDGAGENKVLRGLQDVDQGRQDGWWSKSMRRIEDWGDNTAVGRAVLRNPVSTFLTYGMKANVHDVVETDIHVQEMWDHAEVFDYKTELLFRYLQVFSAMVMSFAHGANDAANAVGPYAAIFYIWQNRKVPGSKSPVPDWIYALGGGGISIGLAVYGFKIMRVLGVKVAKMTNARGFAAELSTSIVVLVASRYGLPISTTQVITGAILAVGLFEGAKGVNWWVVLRTFTGWVLTLFVAAGVSGAVAAFGVYGPSRNAASNTLAINKILFADIRQMQAQLYAYTAANDAAALNTTVASMGKTLISLSNATTAGYIDPIQVAQLLNATLSLYNQTLVLA